MKTSLKEFPAKLCLGFTQHPLLARFKTSPAACNTDPAYRRISKMDAQTCLGSRLLSRTRMSYKEWIESIPRLNPGIRM